MTTTQNLTTTAHPESQRTFDIVVLGGGFGGLYTARRLEKLTKKLPNVRVTLISRDNYFLMTPLLFEAGSGILEPRHAVNPIRPLFRRVRFVEAEISGIDFDKKQVVGFLSNDERYVAGFDQIVIALGSITNTSLVPGSHFARTFKTMADAIWVRNHIIDCFERADVESDPKKRQALMTFVIVGGGLVGVELIGEFTEFIHNVKKHYRNVPSDAPRFTLIEAGPRIMQEMNEELSAYAARVLQDRGVIVRTGTRVKAMDRGKVIVSDAETIDCETIIISTGVRPNPLVDTFPLAKDRRGRIQTDATMRSTSHPFVWALGDNAAIPDPTGHPYPPLAQHAIRQAKCVADNICAVYRNKPPRPFVYATKGTLASLGQFKGVGKVYFVKIRGFLAWWVWRTYYLMQMPRMQRRLRIVLDWTITLFFKNDVTKLDVDYPKVPAQAPPTPPVVAATTPPAPVAQPVGTP
jgi:NADH dehydrogenase